MKLKHRRAYTPEEKRTVVERVLAAWLHVPDQRLAQFIINATRRDPFHVEDYDLAAACEEYVAGIKTCGADVPLLGGSTKPCALPDGHEDLHRSILPGSLASPDNKKGGDCG